MKLETKMSKLNISFGTEVAKKISKGGMHIRDMYEQEFSCNDGKWQDVTVDCMSLVYQDQEVKLHVKNQYISESRYCLTQIENNGQVTLASACILNNENGETGLVQF